MRGRRRTCSVSGAEILVTVNKADDILVFVLFLIVSRRRPALEFLRLIVI